MTSQKRAVFLALTLAAGALAGGALAQPESGLDDPENRAEAMTFVWTAPTTGSPVAKYEVQIRQGGAASTDITNREVFTTEVTFPVDWMTLYEVRVRAVDAANRAGPWSIWSQAENRDHEAPSF